MRFCGEQFGRESWELRWQSERQRAPTPLWDRLRHGLWLYSWEERKARYSRAAFPQQQDEIQKPARFSSNRAAQLSVVLIGTLE